MKWPVHDEHLIQIERLEARPTRLLYAAEDPDTIHRIRRLYCSLMSSCLSLAAREDWIAMSCENCHVDAPVTIAEMTSDLDGMVKMWNHPC